MKFLVTAIVRDPSSQEYNGDYVKIAYNSEESDVQRHMTDLTMEGWVVLSVRADPATFMGDTITPTSGQGNMAVVDGKQVLLEDTNEHVNNSELPYAGGMHEQSAPEYEIGAFGSSDVPVPETNTRNGDEE
jgi:hypothetical protein